MRAAGRRWTRVGAVLGSGVMGVFVLTAAWAGSSIASAAAPPAQICVADPFTWFGPQTIEPGASVTVGAVAVAESGVQLIVTATDSSPIAVPIAIGGTTVGVGAAVAGGEVTITNAGAASVEISSIAVGLDRCHQVAVEAPGVVDLPETGRMSLRVAASAVAMTIGGIVLVLISRRRRAPS
ncbi:MAG: hypothetical protein ABIR32_21945 [Ilumatobacteraceae bacterium]